MVPIDLGEFEDGEEVVPGQRVDRKKQVRQFLVENNGKAWTQKEVSEKLDMNSSQARSILVALEKEQLVVRKICKDEKDRELIHYKWVGK